MKQRKLWYSRPATKFLEALPLGSGRLGMMVYGRPGMETLSLNEDSMWLSGPLDRHNPDGAASVKEVEKALLEGDLDRAHFVARHGWLSTPRRQNPYIPAGILRLDGQEKGELADYRRELDLDTATATTSYSREGNRTKRTHFASFPHGVLVSRVETSSPRRLAVNLERRGSGEFPTRRLDARTVCMEGTATAGGVQWCVAWRLVAPEVKVLGMTVYTPASTDSMVLCSIHTSYRQVSPAQSCLTDLDAAEAVGFDGLHRAHVADHQALYRRVQFDLSAPSPDLPTDKRLLAYRTGATDPDLEALFFDYGRYLLIASSRPGSLPATLQGRWNEDPAPAWDSKYTININTEMNYWPAEAGALGECHVALFDHVARMAKRGTHTAKVLYGARGWCAHHNTDLWADTAPVDDAAPAAAWPYGGAWLTLHLVEHVRFSGDGVFLREKAWPILAGCARFILDTLVPIQGGVLVTGPSTSPENTYILPPDRVKGQLDRGQLCLGPTMDRMIAAEIFKAILELHDMAGSPDPDLVKEIRDADARLLKPQVGKHGQIVEWIEDFDEAEPGHRHISHLFGWHPGSTVTLRGTPALAEAVKATLARRMKHGGGQTGWSRAWLINHTARLEDGAGSLTHYRNLLAEQCADNLMDLHPPQIFQIDGNLGATAGAIEMLLQSHADEISLLPALPPGWPQGEITGLKTRGGLSVDMAWENRKITEATLTATRDASFSLRLPGKEPVNHSLKKGEKLSVKG